MTDHTNLPATARAVRFHEYGGPEVLRVEDIPMPVPGAGEALVAVRAAGINPGEAIIRSGVMRDRLPATFPSGEGTDLAGVVVAVGDGVDAVAIGHEVLGYSWTRASQASHVVVPATQLVPKPSALAWEVAGALDVAGTTAWAAVEGMRARQGEVIAVSGATGGVGVLVVQLLVRAGATVLAIAGGRNADWLRSHGAVPVEYGEGLADRLRELAPAGIDGFVDLHGPDYLHLAVELGVPRERIETIVYSDATAELGIRMAGAATLAEGTEADVLSQLAELLASGVVELPIAATFPFDDVRAAFDELATGHSFGKIVLIP